MSSYVSVQPAIDKSKELGKAASKTGVKGELTCKAEGNPVVNFQWRKVGREGFSNVHGQYSGSEKQGFKPQG